MPIVHDIDLSRAVVRTLVLGEIDVEDVRRHAEAIAHDAAFGLTEIIDARGAAAPGMTVDELRGLASDVRAIVGPTATGARVVVVGSLLHYALAQMFAVLISDRMSIEVFMDMRAALERVALAPVV